MLPNFIDSWSQVGSGNGFTAFVPNPTMKLDYWLEDNGGKAQPNWSSVITGSGGISDHYAVQTSFRIFP
jgi:hypothetical protein